LTEEQYNVSGQDSRNIHKPQPQSSAVSNCDLSDRLKAKIAQWALVDNNDRCLHYFSEDGVLY
jgi:hypothetical protein